MKEVRYMISDAAKKLNVEPHVLRYWEEELGTEIPRNEMGHRYYREEDIRMMRGVKYLKEKGFQLKSIKILLPEVDKAMQLPQRRLLELRDRLELAVSQEELRLQREAELKNYSGQEQEGHGKAPEEGQALAAGTEGGSTADQDGCKAAGRLDGQDRHTAQEAEGRSGQAAQTGRKGSDGQTVREQEMHAKQEESRRSGQTVQAGRPSGKDFRTAASKDIPSDSKRIQTGQETGKGGRWSTAAQETDMDGRWGTAARESDGPAAKEMTGQETGKPDRQPQAARNISATAAQTGEGADRRADGSAADHRLAKLGSGTQADKLVSSMLAENEKETCREGSIEKAAAQPAATPIPVSENAERMRQFRRIMNEIIMDVMRENNKELTENITSSVSREVEYHMRRREMLQEEHFKQLDRTLREYQLGQKQAAVAKECGSRRESKFFKKNGKVRI